MGAWPLALRVDGTLFVGQQLNTSNGRHFCRVKLAPKITAPTIWKVCVAMESGAPQSSGQTHGTLLRAGPLHMALRQAPVCIVHGDGPGQKAEAGALAFKMYFMSRFTVPIIDAGKTPPNSTWARETCGTANLLLLGSPLENTWTAHFRCAFPYVQFLTDPSLPMGSFALGGNAYTANHSGVLALGGLPNGHLALLLHAIGRDGLARVTGAVPVTSGSDTADFLVLGPDYGWQGMGGVLASGILDADWHIASCTGWREPEHSVAGVRAQHLLTPLDDGEPSCQGYLANHFKEPEELVRGATISSKHRKFGLLLPLIVFSTSIVLFEG